MKYIQKAINNEINEYLFDFIINNEIRLSKTRKVEFKAQAIFELKAIIHALNRFPILGFAMTGVIFRTLNESSFGTYKEIIRDINDMPIIRPKVILLGIDNEVGLIWEIFYK